MADTPTINDAFGSSPTVDQAFGPEQDNSRYTGDFADYFFSKTKAGRVMSAFGQGASQAWGADNDLDTARDLKNIVSNSEWLKSFTDNNKTLSKSINEYFIRPYAHVFDLGVRSVQSVFGSVQEGTARLGQELDTTARDISTNKDIPGWSVDKQLLAPALGSVGEVLGHIAGAPMDPSNPENTAFAGFLEPAPFLAKAGRARAHGIIGEGESGFFNTRELTPEQIQQRVNAANDNGIGVPDPMAVEIDPNLIARKIDPDTFKEYDLLKDKLENLRITREYLEAQRQPKESLTYKFTDEQRIQKSLDEIQKTILETDIALRDLIPKTSEARLTVENYLKSDTPEGEAFRKYVQGEMLDAHIKQLDLQDSVDLAYNRANEILPSAEEQVKINQKKKAVKSSKDESGTSKDDNTTLVADKTQIETAQVQEGGNLTAVEGTGELKTRGLSSKMESLAVEKELTEGFSDLPEYRTVSMKDQAEKAVSFIESSPDLAVDVVMGRARPPEGIFPESVLVALEKKAIADANIELLQEIATASRLSTEATTMGQRIRSLAERDRTSPVGILQDIENTRKGRITESEINKTGKEIETYIEQVPYNESAWHEWLKSIECDY